MLSVSFRSASRLGVLAVALFAPVAAAADAPPIDPAGLPGPLVIVGAGKVSEDALKAFFDLAGKEKAKIVVIPAPADAEKTGDEARKPLQELKPLSVEVLAARDRKQADSAEFTKPLADATGVWITGGPKEDLLDLYRGTAVEKELKKLHARGAVIGCRTPSATDVVLQGGPGPIASRAGFGFLPGFVFNYVSESRAGTPPLLRGLADLPGYVGIAVGASSAVVVRGRVARVIGDEAVTVCVTKGAGKPEATDEYKPGSLLDIVQLRRAAANRAAKAPFPPAEPAAPVVPKGTLVVIGGGGSTAEMWERFIKASGGPDALIVVLPTALEDPLPETIGEVTTLKRFGAKNVKVLHTRDPKEADDPKFSEALTKAGGVWFGGGRQWRFVDAFGGTLTEKRIHEVLERGGAIGGSSAGASIQSEYMPRGHPLGNTVMAAEGYEKGFGFLPGCAVDQHFFARKRFGDMTGLMKKYPQYLGIGLDEATAIIVTGSVAEVVGKSKVAVYDPRKKPTGDRDYEELKHGDRYDLKKREKLEK
ncbi:cyanophycinase : Cyanophycinase OS=Isosphaera pallida (strain ATCC 43644 / DSM 9630 / IS1B) GN=Isop_2690 PE=4 SV=1: Peptidase_S51 [Gemmataceae bacterium]|nr:cyanophycinase : Cyanophycinase OS=Isosphaera pallida (strain ATCC 43644 / DSM 9630 / IS1B) GN=Isop_2690 PE=4 SV=1: Peptidase_S51 [Gemmataceae bacterium]VTU00841.1 cyanophycinase : Cyanophycinase OS=Isosphaera pallida (strain ATCC 43644 / DSM 9630 / IS1B) GN=Isop_2690 PE=4 SV=1: Peptidase_S51 [Gemmataceae bacterium]